MAVELPSYIAGEAVRTDRWLDVHYPWDNSLTGRVAVVGPEHLDQAIHAAIKRAEAAADPLSAT